jgi:hypothetical protein
MKKVLLALLVTALSLAVAAPSYASRGREAPPTAHIAKKKCKKKQGKKKCKKKKKVVTPPAPTPRPLTDAEVINQVRTRAAVYCAQDPLCVDYGYYFDPVETVAACTSKSTYQWACLGWNDEEEGDGGNPDATCRFREIIDRVGIDGITSHQDLTYNPPDGWICGPWEGP